MHLGVDIIVNALPQKAKKVVFIISNLLVLYVLYLLLVGSWDMTILNMNSTAPATGLPLSFLYGIGIVTAISMAAIVIVKVVQALTTKDAALVMVSSSDEVLEDVQNHQINPEKPAGLSEKASI
jgi:TRAP-type C4-dicarboxylate transport system permease small subunit